MFGALPSATKHGGLMCLATYYACFLHHPKTQHHLGKTSQLLRFKGRDELGDIWCVVRHTRTLHLDLCSLAVRLELLPCACMGAFMREGVLWSLRAHTRQGAGHAYRR